MVIVGSPQQTEALLLAGDIPCPVCAVQLLPTGMPAPVPLRAWAMSD